MSFAAARLAAIVVTSSPLPGCRRPGVPDRRVGAVGGHEVDQRLGVLEVLTEVRPAGVGRQLRVVGLGVDLPANVVERRNAGVTSPGHVERGQVEREAQQVVAERLGHELVELVADLVGGAHDDGAGRLLGGVEAALAVVEVLGRVQERGQQRERVVGLAAVGVRGRARHVVVEHGVAEAVDRVGELGLDGRVDVRAVDVERPDCRAAPCVRTPRTRGAGTPSRSRSGRPGRGARRSSRRATGRPAASTAPAPRCRVAEVSAVSTPLM